MYSNDKPTPIHFLPKFCSQCGKPVSKKFVPEENCDRMVCSVCGHIEYLNPKVVAGAIIVRDGKIVLMRRGIEPSKGKWTYPAGYMELNETVSEGAVRETLEEIGFKIKINDLIGIYSYPNYGAVMVVYEAVIEGGSFKVSSEASEIAEFIPENIPWDELAFKSTHAALKDWVNKNKAK